MGVCGSASRRPTRSIATTNTRTKATQSIQITDKVLVKNNTSEMQGEVETYVDFKRMDECRNTITHQKEQLQRQLVNRSVLRHKSKCATQKYVEIFDELYKVTRLVPILKSVQQSSILQKRTSFN